VPRVGLQQVPEAAPHSHLFLSVSASPAGVGRVRPFGPSVVAEVEFKGGEVQTCAGRRAWEWPWQLAGLGATSVLYSSGLWCWAAPLPCVGLARGPLVPIQLGAWASALWPFSCLFFTFSFLFWRRMKRTVLDFCNWGLRIAKLRNCFSKVMAAAMVC
jgi:hypothetical protein